MAVSSGIGRRVEQVFGLMGVPLMCLAATVGLGETQALPPRPSVAAVRSQESAAPSTAPQTVAQSATAAIPKFEATSVKLCGDSGADRRTGDFVPGGRGGSSSPGRLRLGCWTVKDLIKSAYLIYADGHDRPLMGIAPTPIEGGPAWIDSDRFTIDAKSEAGPGQETMRGPMLQALLEDRFKLRIRRQSREVPVYELTVANGGPKLQPAKEGGCIPGDRTGPPLTGWRIDAGAGGTLAPDQEFCSVLQAASRGMVTVVAQAATLGEFSQLLGLYPAAAGLGRPVIDKTGIAGLFDLHLEYRADGGTTAGGASGGVPETATTGATSIFTALQQIGLRLEPATGLREFLVIESVDEPSGN
ncbi:MAG: TIGR03435 family protein [Bryobacteraceae bacterium]|jgi:uncharacterized protein (TIGR03435 family)